MNVKTDVVIFLEFFCKISKYKKSGSQYDIHVWIFSQFREGTLGRFRLGKLAR